MVKNHNMTLTSAAFAIFAFILLYPIASEAQSYANTVWKQLMNVYEVASDEGYSNRGYIVAKLDDDETTTWTHTLYGGNDYVIIGACDGDCIDIDLKIRNEDGKEIDSDTSSRDVAAVEVRPKRKGRYTIQIKMYECKSDPCYYGLGIFYR